MNYCIRRTSYYFAVGFWLDESRWIESSNWYSSDAAQGEADRLNAAVQMFKADRSERYAEVTK